jgi:hypothetical protein
MAAGLLRGMRAQKRTPLLVVFASRGLFLLTYVWKMLFGKLTISIDLHLHTWRKEDKCYAWHLDRMWTLYRVNQAIILYLPFCYHQACEQACLSKYLRTRTYTEDRFTNAGPYSTLNSTGEGPIKLATICFGYKNCASQHLRRTWASSNIYPHQSIMPWIADSREIG